MTRVNCVSPLCLYDQHLMAEYREISRVIAGVRKFLSKKNCFQLDEEVPKAYCFGIGHVKFFYNKLTYIVGRHEELRHELVRRNFKLTPYIWDFGGIPASLFNDYEPTKEAIELSKNRILEKIKQKPEFYRYYGK